MARRKPIDESPPPPSVVRPLVRRWFLQIFLLVAVVVFVLAGVIVLGRYAREQLRDHERFQVAFGDIDCNVPLALQRSEFLEEVQYLSALPEKLPILDEDLPDRLRQAFVKHPWVAKVQSVEITRPQTIRVTLVFRQPVLAVVVAADLGGPGFDEPAEGVSAGSGAPPMRLVDVQGFLLPKMPIPRGLPVLHGAPRPAPGAGPWGEDSVQVAALTTALLKARIERLGITDLTWTTDGLVLWAEDIKLVWGGLPGVVRNEEASTAVKEQRLREISAAPKTGATQSSLIDEYDVRPRDGVRHRGVPREDY